jgi:hypothetical protein
MTAVAQMAKIPRRIDHNGRQQFLAVAQGTYYAGTTPY